MMEKPVNNPFKGLYCYEEIDKDIFFGRDNEAAELFSLVALNVLNVVFGKSGIGKTSLLNAGLFPKLREEGFLPVRLRLDYSPEGLPLLDQVKLAIQKELKEHDIVEIEKGGSEPVDSFTEGESLWEYFHRVNHINKSFCGGEGGGFLEKSPLPTITPVLVFDQFEELFTIGKHHAQRDMLLEELYWLVEDQVPPEVKERILTRQNSVPYLRAQAAVRVLFGLREDYLPHLNALKRRIPSIHRVLFRIIHLNGVQARQVMNKSGAFTEDKIKEEILRQFYPADMEPGQAVTDEKLEVEPALLSLLCYQVFEQGVETLSGQEKDAILEEFYDRVLGELPRDKELGEWIETHLLTEGGFRTPRYLERAHALREIVDAAVDKKLLRRVYIGEKEHVEIIHDVLAPLIRERRNRRLEEKKRKELEKEMRRKRVITTIIAVAGMIAIALSIFAFMQMNRADEQRKNAEENEKLAIKEKNRADEQKKIAVINQLASESGQLLLTDKTKAMRLAEAAYKISQFSPPTAVVRALSTAAYSTQKNPFYTAYLFSFKNTEAIKTGVFSPDGNRVLIVINDKRIHLWSLKGKSFKEWNIAGITNAVFSPDGNKIVTASRDRTARLWNLDGILLATSSGHIDDINSAIFSPDGSNILTASKDKTVKLWDLWGHIVRDLRKHTASVRSAVFSPDGQKILTASEDGTSILWDLNRSPLHILAGHKSSVESAAFSPDGSKILTASADTTAKLRDLQGKILAEFKGHTNWVKSAVFSPDGSKVLTASRDNTAKLWDLQGNLLADLKGHTGSVNSAVFSPDGKRIVTASADGTAIIWLTPEGIMEYLKTAPIPKLTQKDKEDLGIAGFEID